MIFTIDEQNNINLDAVTGVKLWSFLTGGEVFSSPAVANGTVYVGSNDQNVYALNAATGAELWSYTTGYDVVSSPVVANGVVYIGSINDNVYAFNATTGAKLWSYHTGNQVFGRRRLPTGWSTSAPGTATCTRVGL